MVSSRAAFSSSPKIYFHWSGTDKDYVLYLAKLPFKYDKSSFGDIDENLILDHAKQITRMLPGGMNVLGIAVAHLEGMRFQ
ncbi:unnamed protein product, partial [Callosobruchus maculatus]